MGRIIRWRSLPRWMNDKHKRIWIDVRKLEAQLRCSDYIGPRGLDGIDGRYEGVEKFLASHDARLEMIWVCMRDKDGRRFVGIYDGRHRFAWMRDHGAPAIPVIAPIAEARKIQKLVGSKACICRVTADAQRNILEAA
jgi:hypothetical protein